MSTSDPGSLDSLEQEVAAHREKLRGRIDELDRHLAPSGFTQDLLAATEKGGAFIGDSLRNPELAPVVSALFSLGALLLTEMQRPGRAATPRPVAPVYPYARATRNGLQRVGLGADAQGVLQAEFRDDAGNLYRAAADAAGNRAGPYTDAQGRRYSGFIDELGYPVRNFRDEAGNELPESAGWGAHDWPPPASEDGTAWQSVVKTVSGHPVLAGLAILAATGAVAGAAALSARRPDPAKPGSVEKA
ncbi:MAG TPA: hypothetical protein VG757_12935 [Devosia sp.]|nr:hypothetical protein [Devosia sp.]